ncbi:LysR family transcriptional regulator [Yersinia intermedia]|uniref:LysR family transcriptional regulator n=1 Tax=Yersinia intermedia TaxID=631 RepID=UPI0005DEA035|nr:LysR family transcriptional regulator [Yersinia intermedia]CNE30556.1 putative DNA-binding transcriptional regulator [Yersinia intermedia]
MNDALKLNQLNSFVAVVEAGSFTRGALRSGQSKALVSLHVKQLESELGVSLLHRNTRSLSLTEIGTRFYQDCLHVLQAAQLAIENARNHQQSLRGTLRISASAGYGSSVIVPALAQFAILQPALKIEYLGSEQYNDLVAEGLDLAIRIGSGLQDNNYRARKIDQFRLVVVAAPDLLQRYPTPRGPQDLLSFPWVGRPKSLEIPLVFDADGKERQTLLPTPHVRANQFFAIKAFAEAGVGLAALPPQLVQQALTAGRLCQLLPEYQLPRYEIFAVYPNTSHPPIKVRALIDFLLEYIAESAPSAGGSDAFKGFGEHLS